MSRGCILNAAGMNQYLPAQELEMPARASERPGLGPVLPSLRGGVATEAFDTRRILT